MFMLELYGVILQIRTTAGPATDTLLAAGKLRDDQLFFVPSLLSDFDDANDATHPALSYWHSSEKAYVSFPFPTLFYISFFFLSLFFFLFLSVLLLISL
jgi:hypothetical protein